MLRFCMFGLLLGAFACPAGAYYVAWEGDCLPEEAGWTRVWGDWSGQYHGTGAVRTLADGAMTMDSLYDRGVYDYALMYRQVNPVPGELLVMEWRLAVDEVEGTIPGTRGDPGIALISDDRWAVGLRYDGTEVFSAFEDGLHIKVSPGEFHDYRMTSWDLRSYDLFIDGELVYSGSFWYQLLASQVDWGDICQGAASVARWDYFRLYTVPEPACVALLLAVVACVALRRHVS